MGWYTNVCLAYQHVLHLCRETVLQGVPVNVVMQESGKLGSNFKRLLVIIIFNCCHEYKRKTEDLIVGPSDHSLYSE